MARSGGETLDAVYDAGDRVALGHAFASARKKRGISQRQLEDESKIPQGKISRIERGVTYPTIRELDSLAGALQLRVHLVILDDADV